MRDRTISIGRSVSQRIRLAQFSASTVQTKVCVYSSQIDRDDRGIARLLKLRYATVAEAEDLVEGGFASWLGARGIRLVQLDRRDKPSDCGISARECQAAAGVTSTEAAQRHAQQKVRAWGSMSRDVMRSVLVTS